MGRVSDTVVQASCKVRMTVTDPKPSRWAPKLASAFKIEEKWET